jgi:hypothetical protein
MLVEGSMGHVWTLREGKGTRMEMCSDPREGLEQWPCPTSPKRVIAPAGFVGLKVVDKPDVYVELDAR